MLNARDDAKRPLRASTPKMQFLQTLDAGSSLCLYIFLTKFEKVNIKLTKSLKLPGLKPI